MGCLGECWDVGPPPDTILNLPPPPLPAFLQQQQTAASAALPDLLSNTTPCFAAQLCESFASTNNKIFESGDYVELPRKDIETWSISGIDDTWLLVLVASSIGVLLLGALLAMFLLKCREMHMFEDNDCANLGQNHAHRQIKSPHLHSALNESSHMNHASNRVMAEHCGTNNTLTSNFNGTSANNNKFLQSTAAATAEQIFYHHHQHQNNGGSGAGLQDNRMVWATLTPRGTQHFVSDCAFPNGRRADLIDYNDNSDDHYEAIDDLNVPPILTAAVVDSTGRHGGYQHNFQQQKGMMHTNPKSNASSFFDNSGFVDSSSASSYNCYDYEEPAPLLMESSQGYQMNSLNNTRITDQHQEHPQVTMVTHQGQHNLGGVGGGNPDMRCVASLHNFASNSTLKRNMALPVRRPRVSSPTRIENPNLPPLNLYPQNASVAGGNSVLSMSTKNVGNAVGSGSTLKRNTMTNNSSALGSSYHQQRNNSASANNAQIILDGSLNGSLMAKFGY